MAEVFLTFTCRWLGLGRMRSALGVYVNVYLLQYHVSVSLDAMIRAWTGLPNDFADLNTARLVHKKHLASQKMATV